MSYFLPSHPFNYIKMKKSQINYLVLLLITITTTFILACRTTDDAKLVSLVEKSFKEEVPLVGNLTFTFNKDLVDKDELNKWDTIPYIQFNPPIDGRFRWDSTNVLTFSPIKSLKPSTNYKGELTTKLLSNKLQQRLTKENTFAFHTPYLALKNVQSYWAVSNDNPTDSYAHFDLSFNTKVRPSDLANHLNIEVEGKNQEFNLLDTDLEDRISLYLPNLKIQEDKELAAKIVLKKGLMPIEGDVGIESAVNKDFTIASPFKLTIDDVLAEHDGMEGKLIVATSQAVNATGIKDFIEVTPEVDFSVSTSTKDFTITSEEFDVNKKYKLVIRENLKGNMGGKLKYAYQDSIFFGKLKPDIKFANKKGIYLTPKGENNLAVSIVNVPKVEVKIYKVYENNLLQFASNRYSYYDYYEEEYYDDYYYDNYSDGFKYSKVKRNLGDLVWEKTYETREELDRSGVNRLLNMDFEDKLRDYQGVYMVEVRSADNIYLKDRKVVSLSDIGLIVKKGEKSLTVFANSIKTTQPLANVRLTLIGKNNQVLETIVTDGNGVAVYPMPSIPADGFKVALIGAYLQDDFNFIPLSMTQANTSRYDVGGRTTSLSGFDAFIYAERDIYRPGETINISTIIRDEKWNTPGEIPVKFKMTNPSGQEIKKGKKTLSAHGSFETAITLPAAARTGTYTAEVYTSNDILLSSKYFKVEEFVPDRIKVNLDLNKKELMPGESLDLTVTALNMFGPPAANRNYEVEMNTKKRRFSPPKNNDYDFAQKNLDTYFESVSREGQTDANGQAVESFDVAEKYSNMGVLQSDLFVTVFDETGRPVNRRAQATIYTQEVFYGIGYGDYYNTTGKKIKVPLIAVDKKGNALNKEARVKLIKHEYKTVLSKSGSYFRYTSQKEEKVLANRIVKLKGTGAYFDFTPEVSGRYEVRVYPKDINTYVSNFYYAYGYGQTTRSSFQVNNEGQIDIEVDKKKYKTGDYANVLFKTPFDGKMLVTVESDKVIDHQYVYTDNRSASLPIQIKDAYVPNVYISATLFKEHEVSEIPLTVAHGFKPVLVENPNNKIDIQIDVPEKSRSRVTQTIRLQSSEPNSALTVAVVDEGILQLTNYKTPNPYDFFYRKRALEVNTYDVYPYLYPEIEGRRQSSTGGDEAMSLDKRVNPLPNKRIKLVNFWSGILQTDATGAASFDIDIPEFSGDLRIMAVSYKDNKFGASDFNMKVADPIVISTALPRFFSPSDTVEVPVILTNTTEKTANCKTELVLEGPVKAIGTSQQNVEIPPNQEKEVRYRVLAKPEIGQAVIKVNVDGLGESFVSTTDMTVRPASGLQKTNESGLVQGGKSVDIPLAVQQFMPASIDQELYISNSPLVQFTDDLEYLVRYPYGCIEQTVSKAFPQLYLTDIMKNVLRKDLKNLSEDPANNIQAAINRVKLMQLHSGGMTYWPGSGSESWWGTVYAGHFLVEAKKAGYEVDESMLKKLYQYLRSRLKERKVRTYYYNGNKKRDIAPREVPYSLFVLALAGQPQLSSMNYYKGHQDQLSLDGKYMLAAAYALSGDRRKYEQVIPKAFTGEVSKKVTGGSFYSPLRDEALALTVLLEVDPKSNQIADMAKHVSTALKKDRYLNTQERSFSFLAMGKIAKMANEGNVSGSIKLDGKEIATYQDKAIRLKTEDLKGKTLTVDAQGDGDLYYFWSAEGISKDGSYKQEDQYIKARKTFFDRKGKQINELTFKQNDLVVVRLSITNGTTNPIENIALADILPAGFEIENPNVTEMPDLGWIKDRNSYDYRDIRDDRITYFLYLGEEDTKNYYYVVRAVSKGIFQMGPVGADAMYDPEIHSYHGGGVVTVLEK